MQSANITSSEALSGLLGLGRYTLSSSETPFEPRLGGYGLYHPLAPSNMENTYPIPDTNVHLFVDPQWSLMVNIHVNLTCTSYT